VVTPLGLISRLTRTTMLEPAIGRCPICQESIRQADASMTIRGGLHVHRACATYRMRQNSPRR
jgi:hypothetical protein